MNGFVSFYLLRPDDSKSPYIAMSMWKTKQDYQEWLKSDHFRQSHSGQAAFKDAFSAPPVMETHEVAIETVA